MRSDLRYSNGLVTIAVHDIKIMGLWLEAFIVFRKNSNYQRKRQICAQWAWRKLYVHLIDFMPLGKNRKEWGKKLYIVLTFTPYKSFIHKGYK